MADEAEDLFALTERFDVLLSESLNLGPSQYAEFLDYVKAKVFVEQRRLAMEAS